MTWLLSALLLLSIPSVGAMELPGIPVFIDEMVFKHQFKRDDLEQMFQRAQYRQAVINAISAPTTIKPWPQYRAAFTNTKHISDGLKFWQNHMNALQRAEKEYGVPQEMIVAVIGVETNYGRNTGKFNILDALTTLAFDYPRRADFFRNELEQYLLLAREQKFEPFKTQGSYAGALGIPQFMPSSYRKHAVGCWILQSPRARNSGWHLKIFKSSCFTTTTSSTLCQCTNLPMLSTMHEQLIK